VIRSRCLAVVMMSFKGEKLRVLRTSQSRQRPVSLVQAVRVASACIAASGLALVLGGVGPSGAATSHIKKSVVISTLKTSKFGTILVSGKTLYTLKPSSAACTASCQKFWPELLLPKGVTSATAGKGVSAAKLGTVVRSGGALQVTYAGKPLYWYVLDTAPGQVKGNVTDTWGKWSDVATIKPAGGVHTTTTTSPGGGGVGF